MALGHIGRDAADAMGAGELAAVETPSERLPWSAHLPVAQLALDSVALSSLALNAAREARGSGAARPVRVDAARVAASFGSDRLIRIDGEPPAVWAQLSGFWPTADGWVRTHANYPHHERALRSVAGVTEFADREDFARALLDRTAGELEDRAAVAGAVVAAVRTPGQWRRHPQAVSLDGEPIVSRSTFDGATPRPWLGGDQPLSGVRVLDLTRVIAGPVAARDLALAGAEVLRVDSPRLPETPWMHLDTGQGKRSALVDLADADGRAVFERLLTRADVLLTGYRPGSLARFGLDPAHLADRHPGMVTAAVSAWGFAGPWSQRRGFDSIVQAATGIAVRESVDGVTPGALPVQALDHATGHFLAAAITNALIAQRRHGGSIDVRMSLARLALALLDAPATTGGPGRGSEVPTRERAHPGPGLERLVYAAPVLAFTGAPDDYPSVGATWGADAAAWAASDPSSTG